MSAMLPVMQTDIMLSKDDKTLIIDAKYYSKTTLTQYNVNTLHSGNLYQIFTYVKNKEDDVYYFTDDNKDLELNRYEDILIENDIKWGSESMSSSEIARRNYIS